MYRIKRASGRSHVLVHLVTDRACLCAFHNLSGLPIRTTYKHFKTRCEHTSDKSPTGSSSSFLKLWSSKEGFDTLYSSSVFLFDNSQSLSTHFWARPSMSWDHGLKFFPSWEFSAAPTEIRDSKHFVSIGNDCVRFELTLSALQVYVTQKWSWFVKTNMFHQFLLLSSHFGVIHVNREE